MNTYIPVDKLIAEIERLNSLVPYENNDRHDDGLHDAYKAVKNAIGSLQQEQPEVDIEKEIEEHAINMPHGEFTHESECEEHEEWAMKEFRYFYKLGQNARKEE